MKSAAVLVFALLVLASTSATAQSHKCTGADGKVVLQQAPCPVPATSKAASAPLSTTDLIVRCSRLPKESSEYNACNAQLTCREAGNQGSALTECVSKLTEGRRRAGQSAQQKAEPPVVARSYALSPRAPAKCLNGDAPRVRKALDEITVWMDKGDFAEVRIRADYWALMKDDSKKRRQLVEAIANTDACIYGGARPLKVVGPLNKYIGGASPETGIVHLP